MICFIYPGQPLEFNSALPDDADFAEIAALTSRRTGFDLSSRSWKLDQHGNQVALQVYGTAISLFRNRLLRRQGDHPSILAEHSMGIYPALAACGSMPEGDALELTSRIGTCLEKMGESTKYALGCIIGLPFSPVAALAENNGVFLANHNTSKHFLVAGKMYAVEDAMAEALERGAFSAKTFSCDAPLHTPLIGEIEHDLHEIVSDYSFAEPEIPLLEHLDQDFLEKSEIPGFLVRELCQPVYWEKTFNALRNGGVTRFIEVGSGESLRKYNRWIISENC